MTSGEYTQSEDIQGYHYHKKRLREGQWLGFVILLIIIVVMVVFLIISKDAYVVKEKMARISEQLGTLQQDYTYLSTDQYELHLQSGLKKLQDKEGEILTIQVKLVLDIMFFVYCYVRNSNSITESKRFLEGIK